MIAAIVLAAGASSRMGMPKRSLSMAPGGPTFLESILATLSAAKIDTACVVVAPGTPLPAGAVVNPEPERGMLSSLQCGLCALPAATVAVVVWPVDHPLVATATVIAIQDAWRGGRHPVVVPVFEGRRGHPALFDLSVFRELLSADPAVGARAVVHAHPDRCELTVFDPGVVTGIDDPEDYRRTFGRDVPRPSRVS